MKIKDPIYHETGYISVKGQKGKLTDKRKKVVKVTIKLTSLLCEFCKKKDFMHRQTG